MPELRRDQAASTGAKRSDFWLSPSYSDGADEWRDGAFRIDVYWFAKNAGDPIAFYRKFWNLMREKEIPFRLHWGKFQPPVDPGDTQWVEFFKGQYPKWADFLALRQARDPNNIFLTDYWRDRLGLWDATPPQATT